MNINDICLFVPRSIGAYKYCCKIAYKYYNAGLAEEMQRKGYWDDSGANYKYIFYLTEFKQIDIPKSEVNAIDKWGDNIPYRIMRVASQKVLDGLMGLLEKQGIAKKVRQIPVAIGEASHDEIKEMLRALGTFKGKTTETKYSVDNYRYDVVWKTLRNGAPTMVFEVQLGGNIDQALTKLRYARQLWTCTPILVTDANNEANAMNRLNGPFQDLLNIIKVWRWEKLAELHDILSKSARIEAELGLG